MFKNRPAMKFILPFIIGIILGWKISLPILPVLALNLFLMIFFILSFRIQGLRRSASLISFILIVLFGTVKIIYDTDLTLDNNISNFISTGREIKLYGSISDLPRISDYSVRFVIDADSVNINHINYSVSGGVTVTVLKKNFDTTCLKLMSYGRIMILQGELTTIRTARNPGEFDLKNYLNLNNIYASFYPTQIDSGCIGSTQDENLLSLTIYPVRKSLSQMIDKLFSGEVSQFLKGLLIGERSEIPLEVKTAFINSGVMHILAVSGLHVAIVTFILIIVLQVLRLPEKSRIIIACILLVYYNFLTGNTPSVTRSVIMAIVFLIGKLFERKSDMYNTLAFSAIVLLLVDAKQLFQPGFQLSFAAVFSIVFLYPKIYNLKNLFPDAVKNNRFVVALIALIAVSVAAGIGTLPFSSIYFGKISVISFIANVIIVPLSNVVLTLGMIAVAFSYLSPWLAGIYAEVTSSLTWLLLKLVAFFGDLPLAYIESRFLLFSSLIFYGVIGAVAQIKGRDSLRKSFIIILVLLNIWFYKENILNDSTNVLKVTFLDVGQGDAIFVEFPEKKNMLIDSGPKTFGVDAGTRFLIPFLKYKGVKEINCLVISHPDADHLGGVPSLLRSVKVDEVIDPGVECKSELCRDYLFLIDSLKLNRVIVSAGEQLRISANNRIYIFNPIKDNNILEIKKRISLNDHSISMKIVYEKTSILLTGDAEEVVENIEIQKYKSLLQSDILKVAHHGSITGTSEMFIRKVHPQYAIISVGAKNKFKHPSPFVINRLEALNTSVYRTDRNGAIVFTSDGNKWSLVNWR